MPHPLSPLLYCCDTWQKLTAEGYILPNEPQQPQTWAALQQLQEKLLLPLEQRYGRVHLSYGFAGCELVNWVRLRAKQGGWLPNIHPPGDQHAGYELNRHGQRICKRDGIAVDLQVPGVSSEEVTTWVIENLPFDRLYLYGVERPFHLSWAPAPVGQVVRMVPKVFGRGWVPRVIK